MPPGTSEASSFLASEIRDGRSAAGAFKKTQSSHVAGHPFWIQIVTADQRSMIVLADSNLVVWRGVGLRD